ncbi:conjugal transfer protein TraO [Flavobacterium oreochromis]|uniref:conjugal transfer protein TraO n=1 Tax=Flavobacterium oreochromis TaxID=2906078 RepID=UPI00385F6AFE
MKKTILSLFLAFSALGYSQNSNSISFNGGITGNKSFGGMINYNYNTNNSNYEIGGVYSTFKDTQVEGKELQFSTIALQLGYFHTIVRNRTNSILINTGLGVTGGYESLKNDDKNIIVKSKDGFIAGVYAGAQLDFYVSDNFALNIRGQQNYYAISTTGKTNPFISLGLKFNF